MAKSYIHNSTSSYITVPYAYCTQLPYSTWLDILHNVVHYSSIITLSYKSVQYNCVLLSTVVYNWVQFCTIWYSIIWRWTVTGIGYSGAP